MKKDRNTFFQSAGMSSQMSMPNFQQPMMQQPMMQPNYGGMPVQQAQASQSFYSGPDFPNNYNVEHRLDELEKCIARLEQRVAGLENGMNVTNVNDYSSKMYMV